MFIEYFVFGASIGDKLFHNTIVLASGSASSLHKTSVLLKLLNSTAKFFSADCSLFM